MTFPTHGTPTKTAITSTTTSHSVTANGTSNTDDLLLLFCSCYAEVPGVSSSGFTLLDGQDLGTTAWAIYTKKDGGSEPSSYTFTTGSARRTAWHMYRISDWGGTISTDVDVGTYTTAINDTPDAPSVTAGWGSDDNLFLVGVFQIHNTNPTITGHPSSYTNDGMTGSAESSAGSKVTTYRRELAAASDNPSAGSFSASSQHVCNTVVVKPGTAGSGGGGGGANPHGPLGHPLSGFLSGPIGP